MTSPPPSTDELPSEDHAEPAAPLTPGGWLRRQRQSRGWAVPEMARRLRDAARAAGDALPTHDGLVTMVRRWERGAGGVSERYRLHYCRAFGLPVEQYGTGPPPVPQAPGATLDVLSAQRVTPAAPASPAPLSCTVMASARAVAYRGSQEREPGRSWIWREVLMTAHESSEHAERSEQREIGDATLEQLRADVIRLSGEFMTGEPFPLFLEMRRVRNRMHAALDRQLWPRDQVELYFLLGCLSFLMAVAAEDLGNRQAAGELLRAGWAYAVGIDHRPLMAQIRHQLADIADWSGQPREARDIAESGLGYQADGPVAILLHLKSARASARLGEAGAARQSISAALAVREREYRDELTDIGGEFDLSIASQHYLVGSVLNEIPGAGSEAATALGTAAELYAAGPGPGETHGYAMEALARINLATARLGSGALDAAAAAVDPVLSLAIGKRVVELPQCFGRTRRELAQTIYRGSAQARELDERIELFCRETVVADLHSLPGGS